MCAIRRVIGILTKQQAQLVTRSDVNAWPRQYRADGIDLSLHLIRFCYLVRRNGCYNILQASFADASATSLSSNEEGVQAQLFFTEHTYHTATTRIPPRYLSPRHAPLELELLPAPPAHTGFRRGYYTPSRFDLLAYEQSSLL